MGGCIRYKQRKKRRVSSSAKPGKVKSREETLEHEDGRRIESSAEYSPALKRVGIESGLWMVLYLQRTDFPYQRQVNMRGRHAAVMIQMSQQTRATLQGWLHREMSPGGASQTRSGDGVVRARPQLRSYSQMGRFDRAQPA